MMNRRESILREMRLAPIWRLRTSHGDAASGEPDALEPENVDEPPVKIDASATLEDPRVRDRRPEQTSQPVRVSRPVPSAQHSTAESAPAKHLELGSDPARGTAIATLDWDELEADIRSCKACVLCEKRRQAVPGVGNRGAQLMLVGEGPGAEEDQRGEPFVGQAGRLLDNMLSAIGLNRDPAAGAKGVYIANAVKCRPPHNRTPEASELRSCLPYLDRQIELVAPRLLIALGRPAAQALLGSEISIGAARGKRFERGGIPVVVTYHPAYLLRNPQDKGKAWEDLCFARRLLSELTGTT